MSRKKGSRPYSRTSWDYMRPWEEPAEDASARKKVWCTVETGKRKEQGLSGLCQYIDGSMGSGVQGRAKEGGMGGTGQGSTATDVRVWVRVGVGIVVLTLVRPLGLLCMRIRICVLYFLFHDNQSSWPACLGSKKCARG
ncbi:hypothetical protein QBC37DRAFT_396070 [Rhypophila decipiens]|uniref:Uncharacterized protein n=1 Tax=Rhypophila decipiens TaxID=261697 RepID=A0AAN6YGK5_9PEZI|nr:hypothetical protein QBC37DRAFT_396070 [Rhypophila decipiens]